MRTITFILIIAAVLMASSLYSDNRLIIYHGNYGMVNETVELSLRRGLNEYTYDKIPAGIMDNTVMLIPVVSNAFHVQTQGLLVETRRFAHLLRSEMNREIEIVTTDGSIINGELFYYDNTLIGLRDKNRGNTVFVRASEIRNYVLKSEDMDYQTQPNLTWTLQSERSGREMANLTYLTTGLSWSGIYKAVWEGDKLNLEILANISNTTEIDYEDVNISLVAGDPKKLAQPQYIDNYRKMGMGFEADMMMESAPASPQFTTEELGDYHIYFYSSPIDFRHAETKQIRLYPPKIIEPELYYEYLTSSKNVLIRMKITNDEKSGLGMPLPRGAIQVYRKTDEVNTALNFVGEDIVEQLPVNEDWIISPGNAFDVVAETRTLETRRPARNVTENDMSVTVKNRSKETKSIVVTHYIRGNWTIQRQNHQHEKIDANRIEFRRDLRPDQEYEFTWTERIEH